MKLTKFFETQRKLDEKIIQEKHLIDQDLFSKKRLALIVELAELANELRESFKFWSNKKNDYDKALVELVDCFHFLLSIGLVFKKVLGTKVENINYNPINAHSHLEIEDVFTEFIASAVRLEPNSYVMYMNDFLALIDTLGFSWEEFEDAYYAKNAENHTRQEIGY